MGKFKIGDRVRALEDYKYLGIRRGDVRKITYFKYSDSGVFYGYHIEGGGSGHWNLRNFELVTDDIKVGDYVSIDKLYPKTGTVERIETYATVKSGSGQDYVRKLNELTPAVRPDPIPAEPAHNTAFRFDDSGLTWVWDKTGWSWLAYDGSKSHNNESWASLWGRYVGRHDKRKTFTVL